MTPRPRILYIEDDEGLARLVERTLARAGYEMVHAPSGSAGVALAGEHAFDLVALDHHLPGETGLDVLPQLAALPNCPPVVYVTGSDDSRVAVAALKGGAVDYVWKDVQGHFRELLVEAVGAALERERLRQAKAEADAEVRAARDRAELLLKEVNHRVSNSLAMVAGFARLQASAVSDPSAKRALEEMQARIHAIAGVHRRLYTSHDVEAVELDAYLRTLVQELWTTARQSGPAHTIRFESPPITVATDKAVSLGIIVTELVTNALKYAYPQGASGEIRVRLEQHGPTTRLIVEDDGVGYSGKGEVKGSGLGMRVVSAMASNLKSKIAIDQGGRGARVTLDFDA